jgi:hypothetical protein
VVRGVRGRDLLIFMPKDTRGRFEQLACARDPNGDAKQY